MFKRLLKLPLDYPNSFFLFGPRGTGKTSWIKTNLPNSLYFDLLNFPTFTNLMTDPSRLDTMIPQGHKELIVIDEVPRIPELLNEVHRLIEKKKYRFLLTGSSARSLKRRGVNLLAGRALRYNMHPLTVQEIGDQFDLAYALQFGMLPVALSHPNPKEYLESYVQTYIQEEVLQESLTRNISAFTRFLEAASYSQGQVLNVSEIARELEISRLVVASYFDILDDLLLATRIPVFNKRAKRKTIAHQKFYFFDAGVYRYLRPRGPLDVQSEIEGVGLETLFYQSLLAINDYFELDYKIYFWRTVNGDEVDFIAYGPKGFFAFEIKHGSSIHSKTLKGLKNFKEEYPEAQCFLLYLGDFKQYHGDITVMPFVEALQKLPELLSSYQPVSHSEET